MTLRQSKTLGAKKIGKSNQKSFALRKRKSAVLSKSYLTHVDLLLKSDSIKKNPQFFIRKLHHSTMGELEEKAFIKRGTLKEDPSGKLEIKSKIHGRIGEIHFQKTPKKGTFLLHSLEVVPWAKKQGFGGQILAETIHLMKKQIGAKRIVLNVEKENQSMISKYTSFGFIPVLKNTALKTRPNEIQMSLKLKD